MKLFDEKEAVTFIRSRVAADSLSDDDILDVIDTIFDYYDEVGELDFDIDDDNDDVAPDEDAIIKYVIDSFADTDVDSETLTAIVHAELAYEQSLL